MRLMAVSADFPEHIIPLNADLARMMQSVEPSVSEGGSTLYPCEVTTVDGSIYSRVYISEAAAYKRDWGVWPWEDRGKGWIPLERIASLRSSPVRMPAKFANELNAAGESGMGYCAFSVKLRNGDKLHFVTGNAVDFPEWPDGVSPDDVVAVTPHDRGTGKSGTQLLGAKYFWSLFRNGDG